MWMLVWLWSQSVDEALERRTPWKTKKMETVKKN